MSRTSGTPVTAKKKEEAKNQKEAETAKNTSGRSAAGKRFDEAFARARRQGLSTFEYNGKKYGTRKSGETKEKQSETLAKNKVASTPVKTAKTRGPATIASKPDTRTIGVSKTTKTDTSPTVPTKGRRKPKAAAAVKTPKTKSPKMSRPEKIRARAEAKSTRMNERADKVESNQTKRAAIKSQREQYRETKAGLKKAKKMAVQAIKTGSLKGGGKVYGKGGKVVAQGATKKDVRSERKQARKSGRRS